MSLTQEQQQLPDLLLNSLSVSSLACPGSGKTYMAVEGIEQVFKSPNNPYKNCLIMYFNKKNAVEASSKFAKKGISSSLVQCSTSHSLAFRFAKPEIQQRIIDTSSNGILPFKTASIRNHFKKAQPMLARKYMAKHMSKGAWWAKIILDRFHMTTDPVPTFDHMLDTETGTMEWNAMKRHDGSNLVKEVSVLMASEFHDFMMGDDSQAPHTFGLNLRNFVLSEPDLGFD